MWWLPDRRRVFGELTAPLQCDDEFFAHLDIVQQQAQRRFATMADREGHLHLSTLLQEHLQHRQKCTRFRHKGLRFVLLMEDAGL